MKGGHLKNLVIVGPPRCGKSTLTQMIADKYPCEIVRGDTLLTTIQKALIAEDIEESHQEKHTKKFIYSPIDANIEVELLKKTYEGIKTDLRGKKKLIIVDTCNLHFSLLENEFGKDAQIYCLAVPNLSEDQLFKNIRLNDTHYDWTTCAGNYMLKDFCGTIVAKSKSVVDELKNYPNIKFVDTSINRREKLEEVFKEIEENIINN